MSYIVSMYEQSSNSNGSTRTGEGHDISNAITTGIRIRVWHSMEVNFHYAKCNTSHVNSLQENEKKLSRLQSPEKGLNMF